jgi:hypothetical protein
MDPISIIGLVGALVGIGDVIGKSCKRLVQLQERYRTSDLAINLLVGQLTVTNRL